MGIKMKLVQAFIIAFAMYSKIPMPKVDWTKENMKYAICFFPLVGAVIGSVYFAVFYLCGWFHTGRILKTMVLVILPVLITGGIHVDGFIDTIDARSSYAERERKLEILKDPHVGAFAVIGCIGYFLLVIGFTSEITKEIVLIVAMGFIFSRALSGLSIVSFRGAKKDGLLAAFSNKASKRIVQIVMTIYLIAVIAGMFIVNPIVGSFCILTGFGCYFYYKHMAYQEFGGTTGDLAGYFLQICELFILMIAVVVQAFL